MAVISNLYIDQGTDFSAVIDVVDANGDAVDLTGYTVAAQIRKTYGSSSATASFTATVSNAASGKITLTLTDTVTAAIDSGRYVYDVNVTSSGGTVTRVIEGQAVITPGVTR
jgi:hypothetical protein